MIRPHGLSVSSVKTANIRTIVLPGDTRLTYCERVNFGAKLEAWRLKMFHNFLFFQSNMVFGIVNTFSWIFDAFSGKKSCPTLMLVLLTCIEFRTAKFFSPAKFSLVNSNFRRASRYQGNAFHQQLHKDRDRDRSDVSSTTLKPMATLTTLQSRSIKQTTHNQDLGRTQKHMRRSGLCKVQIAWRRMADEKMRMMKCG